MKKIIITLMTVWIGQIQAQQAISASGGNATGSGGSSSYTVGQMAYNSYSSSAGSVNQGVQQPYEIFTLATDDVSAEKKEILLYPNPVQDLLYVDFGKEAAGNSSYQLFDAQGKLVKQGNLNQKKNELDMRTLPQSIYIIKIVEDDKNVKTFKIIKK
ncbi:MAG: T9SS type A sorting domain-containing protein [Bergeyella sp.]